MQSSAERVETWRPPRTITVTLPSPYEHAYGRILVEDVNGYAEYGSICYLDPFAFVWAGNEDYPESGEGPGFWSEAREEIENRLALEQRRTAIFCSYQTYKRMQPYARWWQDPDSMVRTTRRGAVYSAIVLAILVLGALSKSLLF